MTRIILSLLFIASAAFASSGCATTVPCGCVKPELQVLPDDSEQDPNKPSATPEQDEAARQG